MLLFYFLSVQQQYRVVDVKKLSRSLQNDLLPYHTNTEDLFLWFMPRVRFTQVMIFILSHSVGIRGDPWGSVGGGS